MRFGGLKALSEFDLVMQPGELVGLIGPNGAGKTTAFNAITGVYTPSEGEVRVGGERVNGQRPHQICARGVARTFQNIRLFKRAHRARQRADRLPRGARRAASSTRCSSPPTTATRRRASSPAPRST